MIRSTLRLGAFSALACLLYACGMQQASLPPLGDHSVVLWECGHGGLRPGPRP